MGLPFFGPKCDSDINIPLPDLFPGGLFGPNPCLFFGGCPPGVGPNPPDPCGPFGCDGYCNDGKGCDPCPPGLCDGPQCLIPTGCGPKPGPNPKPNPTRPPKCEEDQKTTVTEKLVFCTENIKLEPTTIASINFTLSTTVTSTCLTPVLYTRTGCGLLGTTTTTTVSSFSTSTSSGAPVCSRVPLDLNNDEGDNEQPPRTTDGPTCSRAPLSLDDDEGDNEQPTPTEGPSCTRAPLSLDDDEGNNEMPADMSSSLSLTFSSTPTPSANSSSSSMSRVLPPSTLSMSTAPPWGTGIPSGTPVVHCPTCDKAFADCTKYRCKQDGSDAEACAKFCLSALCYGQESADHCQKGPCKPAACPKKNPKDFNKGQPAIPFTTILFLSSKTLTVTATATYTTISVSHSPTPTCSHGKPITPHGKWTALIEHEIKERPDNATLTWTLWDENGCEAGQGSGWNNILGRTITQDIGAQARPREHKMGYLLHTNVTDSLSISKSEIEFAISKPPANCKEWCWVKWKINTREGSKSWQIIDDCARQCGMRKLEPTDVSCDDGMNKWHDPGDWSIPKRGGYCTWRMPFEPDNDDPVNDDPKSPPESWGPQSKWTLDLVQQMEYETSSIEWTLWDPNGYHAGHFWEDTSHSDNYTTQIQARHREAAPTHQMKYVMNLTVTDPRDKDNTTVSLQYIGVGKYPGCNWPGKEWTYNRFYKGCDPSYTTEPNDESRQALLWDCNDYYLDLGAHLVLCPQPLVTGYTMACDPVADKFRPKGAGFERRFKCWWPHMFPTMFTGKYIAVPVDLADANVSSGALGIDGGVNGSWANSTWR